MIYSKHNYSCQIEILETICVQKINLGSFTNIIKQDACKSHIFNTFVLTGFSVK